MLSFFSKKPEKENWKSDRTWRIVSKQESLIQSGVEFHRMEEAIGGEHLFLRTVWVYLLRGGEGLCVPWWICQGGNKGLMKRVVCRQKAPRGSYSKSLYETCYKKQKGKVLKSVAGSLNRKEGKGLGEKEGIYPLEGRHNSPNQKQCSLGENSKWISEALEACPYAKINSGGHNFALSIVTSKNNWRSIREFSNQQPPRDLRNGCRTTSLAGKEGKALVSCYC